MEEYKYTNELYHHGVKGMRWGIRRYQKRDGTLTPAGRRRLAVENKKLKQEETILKNKQKTKAKFEKLDNKKKELDEVKKKLAKSSATEKSKSVKEAKKSVKDLSNEELAEKVRRLELEKRYKDLNPEKVLFGKKVVNDVILPSVTSAGKQVLTDYATKQAKKLLGLDVNDPDKILEKRAKRLENEYKVDKYTDLLKDKKK